jgi:hypothetical protein
MTKSLIQHFDISESRLKDIVADAVHGADDGELFLEYSEAEALMFDNGRLKTANFNTSQGFGLRAVAGEATGYAHASELTEQALLRASDAVSTVKEGYSGTMTRLARRAAARRPSRATAWKATSTARAAARPLPGASAAGGGQGRDRRGRRHHARPARLAQRRRRGPPSAAQRADRGRHPRGYMQDS